MIRVSATKVIGEDNVTINDQVGTSYTLVLKDADCYVRCTNAAAIALTVPPNVDVPIRIGAQIPIDQGGAGQITITEGAGVTVNGDKKITGQDKGCVLTKVAINTWDIHGSLEA